MGRIERKSLELKEEKDIVTGLILSTTFHDDITPILSDLNVFRDKNLRLLAQWSIDYYKKFSSAPKQRILDVFMVEKKFLRSEDDVSTIETILDHLSARFTMEESAFSESYYAHQSRQYIEARALEILADDIKGYLAQGKNEEAKRRLTSFSKVDKVLNTGVNPLTSNELIKKMFDSIEDGVFKLPYPALQELFKDFFRGDVVAVAGPAKRGKSYLMNQLGYWANFSGLNVAIFNFEMEVHITSTRLWQNLLGETRRPMEKPKRLPYFEPSGDIAFFDYQKDGIDPEKVFGFKKRFNRYAKNGEIRLFDAQSCGRKVSDIVDTLHRIERFDGVKIDVVIIDYDALLENESRFEGNEIGGNTQLWKDMKAKIAQDLDCLVITGSQMTRDAIKGEAGVEKTAGNIRKFDYVSHWVSINQTEDEKRVGVMRLDVSGRHDDFNSGDKVVCTQALSIGRPITDARWLKDIPNYKDVVGQNTDKKDQDDYFAGKK